MLSTEEQFYVVLCCRPTRTERTISHGGAKRTSHATLAKRGVYDVPRPVTQDASTGFAKAVTTGEGFTTSGTLRLRSASAAANSR
jgi:hypothetical protein